MKERCSPGPTPQKTDEKIILVLQGGGALGAYQAGAYEALAAADWAPEWVSGISIGAINAAIIAGNRPEERVEKLHAFWNLVSGDLLAPLWSTAANARLLYNEASSAFALLCGIPGFFSPRFPPTYLAPQAPLEELSYYTTESLRETLLTLVDFDLINSGEVRLSVGAVDVATGNFCYFDNHKMEIIPEHIMASGALPPGFAPVRIGEDYFWDGGLVSNTPLQYVLDYNEHDRDICVFQVDLFSARGDVPLTMLDVEQRIKDIRFSSRTRLNTDLMRRQREYQMAAFRLYEKLPPELRADPDALTLWSGATDKTMTIVHLIHRHAAFETHAKDFDFSRLSVINHWEAGARDVKGTFSQKRWKERRRPVTGVAIFDFRTGKS